MAASDGSFGARCIVLGGTGAVGRAACRALHASGARVGFTWRSSEAARDALCKELDGVVSRRLDLTETARIGPVVDELVSELGGVSSLIHAAAVGSAAARRAGFDHLSDIDGAAWDELFAVNVKSAAFACKALLGHWREAAQPGSAPRNVVLLSSIDAVKGVPAPVAYAASKGALTSLASSLAKELGPRGVLVNAIAPGVLDAGISTALPDDLRKAYLKHSGLRRPGKTAEIGDVIAWFATRNTYVTAQTIVVDGGL